MNLETEISGELWSAVRRSYESQAWANAILDAVHFLSDAIRNKSGLQSDGTALAGQAFGGKSPKLRLNRLQTESDWNIQAGMEQIVRGIYQAIRNPRSHEKMEDTQQSADSVILFIGYLLAVIGHAKSAFSIDNVIARIRDENFVPNKRYAELILNEIPKQKRLDTLLIALDTRDQRDSTKVKSFFQAAIKELEESEVAQFFDAVSLHLRDSNDDHELRSVLQILQPSQWPRIGEAERMRSENRLIRNMEGGRYSAQTNKCLGGGLATWAASFLPFFTLKKEAFYASLALLSSRKVEQENYVFRFFFAHFDDLMPEPPAHLIARIKSKLKEGDKRYYDGVSSWLFWESPWATHFSSELENFQEAQSASEPEADDIPF